MGHQCLCTCKGWENQQYHPSMNRSKNSALWHPALHLPGRCLVSAPVCKLSGVGASRVLGEVLVFPAHVGFSRESTDETEQTKSMLRQGERCFVLSPHHRASIPAAPASLLVASTQQTPASAAEAQGALVPSALGSCSEQTELSHRQSLSTAEI